MSIVGTVVFLVIISALVISIIALIKAQKAEKTAMDLQARYISALERGRGAADSSTPAL
jgi:hypothetical protein